MIAEIGGRVKPATSLAPVSGTWSEANREPSGLWRYSTAGALFPTMRSSASMSLAPGSDGIAP